MKRPAKTTCTPSNALFTHHPFALGGATVLLNAELPTPDHYDFGITLEIVAGINTLGELTLTVQRHIVSQGPMQTMDLGTFTVYHPEEVPATVQLLRDALDRIPRLLAATLLVTAP